MRARFQIAAMEGVLERAVQLGARRLSQQVQAVSPDMLFIAGAARAKGFWLDGYGVFFDVDVPAMRRSVAWSFRALDRGDRGRRGGDPALKRNLPSVRDPAGAARNGGGDSAARAHRRTADAAAGRRCPGGRPGVHRASSRPWRQRRRAAQRRRR